MDFITLENKDKSRVHYSEAQVKFPIGGLFSWNKVNEEFSKYSSSVPTQ